MGDFVPYTGEVLKDAPKAQTFKPYEGEVLKDKPRTLAQAGKEAIGNIPKSAVETGEGMLHAVTHPAETAEHFWDLTKGLASKLMRKTGITDALSSNKNPEIESLNKDIEGQKAGFREKTADAYGQYFKARYGSWDGFKKALAEDPVGVAMDIGTIVSGGETLAGKIGGVTGKALRATDPANIGKAAAKATSVASDVGAHTLGHLTGGGPEAIRQAVKAGFEKETQFIDALDGKLPMEQTVKLAAQGVENMRKTRNAQYQALMKTVKADPKVLDFSKVLDAKKAVQDVGHFEGVPLYDKTAELHGQIDKILDAWSKLPKDTYHTPAGLDALKKLLGNKLDNIGFERRADRKYVGDIKRAVTEQIAQQAPIYSKIMKDYSQASEGLEEIERALSLGEKSTFDAGIRKLLSAMRNNANSNYGNRLKMIDALEKAGAKGLKSTLSGAQMSSGMPRGLAGRNPALTLLGALHQPGLLGLLPFESPALVGRSLYGLGSISREVSDLLKGTILPDSSVTQHLPSSSAVARFLNQAGNLNEAQP